MPPKNEIRNEVTNTGEGYGIIRKKYINKLSEKTGRNTIIYYSGFLQTYDQSVSYGINDNDRFCEVIVTQKTRSSKD